LLVSAIASQIFNRFHGVRAQGFGAGAFRFMRIDVYTLFVYTKVLGDFQFQWDKGNIEHLAEHDITPREAEQVFCHFFVERVTAPINGEERYQALGSTDKGRYLVIAFTERGEYTRPITGWDMEPEDFNEYAEELYKRLNLPE